jgi:hypothetical protein
VPFDTDVEQVRKIFKKVGQDIADDPELNQDLLEPFKSQGIADVEDGTLLIRGKFKAKAGKQFAVRKAVLTAVQKAFQDYGIIAVPKPLGLPGVAPPTSSGKVVPAALPAPAAPAAPAAAPAAPPGLAAATAPAGTSS